MTYDELMMLLVKSGPEDWLRNDERQVFTLKSDLDVTIRTVDTEERRPLIEPWATKFPDPVAYRVVYELYYGNSLVAAYSFALVDGARAALPFPKVPDFKTITDVQLAIAEAVNSSAYHEEFEHYISQFEVEKST